MSQGSGRLPPYLGQLSVSHRSAEDLQKSCLESRRRLPAAGWGGREDKSPGPNPHLLKRLFQKLPSILQVPLEAKPKDIPSDFWRVPSSTVRPNGGPEVSAGTFSSAFGDHLNAMFEGAHTGNRSCLFPTPKSLNILFASTANQKSDKHTWTWWFGNCQ